MTKSLDEWFSQMEADPASMVPILATKEGRRELQVTTLTGVVPNLLARLQATGVPLLDAAQTVAPLLQQIKAQEVAAMPLREKPELLWAWWLANAGALQLAKDDWTGVDPRQMALLAFDWMWVYAPMQKLLKANKEHLEIPMNRFIEQLPANAQRPVWELAQLFTVKEPTESQKAKLIKSWFTLFHRLDIGLADMVVHCRGSLPQGASPAFLECAQKSSQEDILALLHRHPTGFAPVQADFLFSERWLLISQPWNSPLGGLALLAGNKMLTGTTLMQHSETQPILGMLDCLGLDINDIATTRQLINALHAPAQEQLVIESETMGSLLGSDGL